MSDVADVIMIEQPDDKKRFIMQKIKIAIAERDCLKLWIAMW
jgi:hypothetical protein